MPVPMASSILDQLTDIQELLKQGQVDSAACVERAEARAKEGAERREERDRKYDEIRQQLAGIIAQAQDSRPSAGTRDGSYLCWQLVLLGSLAHEPRRPDETESMLQIIRENHQHQMDEMTFVFEGTFVLSFMERFQTRWKWDHSVSL
jgi:hypothetical protein